MTIPAKIISREEAKNLGLLKKQSVFIVKAMGKIGEIASDIEIENLDTKEKTTILKNGKKYNDIKLDK